MEKRTADSISAAQESKRISKKRKTTKQRIDFNKYFDGTISNNDIDKSAVNDETYHSSDRNQNGEKISSNEDLTNMVRERCTSKNHVDQSAVNGKFLSNEEMTDMIYEMTATSQTVLSQLKSAVVEINLHRTKPFLGVRDDYVSEEDVPLLEMFKKYNLPIKTKDEVEVLESELENSNGFLKFFVSV